MSTTTNLTNFSFRNATLSDLDEIMVIENACFLENIREEPETFKERITVFPQGFIILIDNQKSKPIGYFSSEIWAENWKNQDATIEEIFDLGHSIEKSHTFEGTDLYISSVAVLPDYRGQKLGETLFNSSLEMITSEFPKIKNMVLMVNVNWQNAIHIYRKAGFVEVLRVKDSFEPKDLPTSDGLIMEKPFFITHN